MQSTGADRLVLARKARNGAGAKGSGQAVACPKQLETGGPRCVCDRQAVWSACLPDGSQVRRESHARFCERPVVKFRRPTQPHICAKKRSNGRFTVLQQTIRKGLQTK